MALPSPCRHPPGSALLVVLWVLALLSFLVVTTVMITLEEVEGMVARKLIFKARQLAETGLAIGSHPLVKSGDPLLRRLTGEQEGYTVTISTEESRLNLNYLLTEERRPVLERLLRSWGLSPADVDALADSLMDWKDDDNQRRLQGAERLDYQREGYPERPYNRPFKNLDEVFLVKGMSVLAELKPDWRDTFTLWGDGRVDVNETSAAVLALVAEVPVSLAEQAVAVRNGRDGIHQTADDLRFESVEEVLTLLGLSREPAQELAAWLTVKGSTLRVESVGHVADYSRGVAVVMKKDPVRPQILEWREFGLE